MPTDKVLAIIHAPSGVIWTGKVSSNNEAYFQAERELGFDVQDCPIYDVDSDEDIGIILAFIKNHST